MAKRILKIAGVLLIALVAAAAWYLAPAWREISALCSEDPDVWADAIAAFEAEDARQPPADGAILFVGSSTIRYWEWLADDMAPLPVFRRGFGGAKVNDVLVYVDRIITNYRPAAVIVYVGGNDVTSVLCNEAKPAEKIVALTRQLLEKIHAGLPGVPVYYVAINPIFRKDEDLARANAVNTAVEQVAEADARVVYIDANDAITGSNDRVPADLLKRDGVHLNRAGYARWASGIRERLLADLGDLPR